MSQQDDYEQTLKAMEQKLLEQRRANSSAKCREDLFATLERETSTKKPRRTPTPLPSTCRK